MIIKQRQRPLRMEMEEALLRRLPSTHKKRAEIEGNLKKISAGYQGELNIDYELSFLPEKEYYIFQDLRLMNGEKAFQLDILILTPYFGLIIETKNISGTLTFDPQFKQMIRTHDQKEEGFLDPIAQVKKQRSQLKVWLEFHKFKPFPIEYLIVISKPSTILRASGDNEHLTQKVLHAAHLLPKIKELHDIYPNKTLTPYLLHKMSHLLIEGHTPLDMDILQHYSIPVSEIQKGVQCPSCRSLPMIRQSKKWYCASCQTLSKTAHIEAIHDFLLLIDPNVSNQRCRDFLLLDSKDIAYRLLSHMKLPCKGTGKARIYHRPK